MVGLFKSKNIPEGKSLSSNESQGRERALPPRDMGIKEFCGFWPF
jgi:hypothetical protein